ASDDIISATLLGAVGLPAGPAELEFGASVPFLIMSGDRGPDRGDMQFKLDGQGLGNIGLHFKTRFLKTSRPPHLGLGVIASVYLPTASPKAKWLGEDQGGPQIMGILDKEWGRQGRPRSRPNAGIRIRGKTSTFDNNDPTDGMSPAPMVPVPVTGQTISVGSEIPFGLGIAYAIAVQKFDIVAELFGSQPLGDHTNYQPLEAIG